MNYSMKVMQQKEMFQIKKTLYVAKVNARNKQGKVVSTHGGRNRNSTRHIDQYAVA